MSEVSAKAPEFEPPQACVSRIIKNVLPDQVQITKDARAAFTRAAGIFIFYITHCANEYSREAKRSTISVADVFNALKELDFNDLEEPLREFLKHYKAEADNKKVSGPKSKKPSGGEAEEEEDEIPEQEQQDHEQELEHDEATGLGASTEIGGEDDEADVDNVEEGIDDEDERDEDDDASAP